MRDWVGEWMEEWIQSALVSVVVRDLTQHSSWQLIQQHCVTHFRTVLHFQTIMEIDRSNQMQTLKQETALRSNTRLTFWPGGLDGLEVVFGPNWDVDQRNPKTSSSVLLHVSRCDDTLNHITSQPDPTNLTFSLTLRLFWHQSNFCWLDCINSRKLCLVTTTTNLR